MDMPEGVRIELVGQFLDRLLDQRLGIGRDAWNRYDLNAWSAHLAEDDWYTEVDDSLYQRFKGREKAVSASRKMRCAA